MPQPVNLLHTGDIHLGRMAGLGQATAAHQQHIERAFARLTEAAAERADILLITGDLLDREALFGTFVERAVSGLATALAASDRLQIVLIAGNHDPASLYRRPEWRALSERVTIVTEPSLLEFEDLDLAMVTLPWLSGEALTWRSWPAGTRVVVAAHTCYPPPPHVGQDCLLTPEEAAGWPASYIALGHYHSISTHLAGATPAVYAGAPEIMDLSHTGTGKAVWVTVAEEGPAAYEFFETGQLHGLGSQAWQWAELAEPRVETLRSRLEAIGDPRALLRVRLEGLRQGPLPLGDTELLDALTDRFFYLDVQDRTEPAPDLEELGDLPEMTVLGRFVKLAREALAEAERRAAQARQAGDGEADRAAREEAAALREALLLGCHLLRRGERQG